MKFTYSPFSYSHVRRNAGMLFNASTPLFGALDRPSRKEMLNKIRTACRRGEDEVKANVGVASAIIDYVESENLTCVEERFAAHKISADASVSYAYPFLLKLNRSMYVPFLDMRRSNRLTKMGIEFLFAMNFHLIIDADPDFENVGLMVLRFPQFDDRRVADSVIFSGSPAFAYEELSNMISTTYRLWRELLEERRANGDESVGGMFA